MAELFFVFKTFIFSLLVLFFMQIKVGDHSIQQHSQAWLQQSSLVHTLNAVARGSVQAITNLYHSAKGTIEAKLGQADSSEPVHTVLGQKVKVVHESQL